MINQCNRTITPRKALEMSLSGFKTGLNNSDLPSIRKIAEAEANVLKWEVCYSFNKNVFLSWLTEKSKVDDESSISHLL